MTVFLVVQWIDGIPETIKIYAERDAAEQCVRVLGGKGMAVREMEVH